MHDNEERLFLERLTLRIWKARIEGAIIGAPWVPKLCAYDWVDA